MPDDPILQALRHHPWIADADRTGDHAVRVRPAPAALAVRPGPGALIGEFLDHWGEVYDWTYTAGRGGHAPDLDLSGWRATDTGRPLPVDHMTEWVERTVELVQRTDPRHVLELGCGTGMLMHRLLPRALGYVGTDLSAKAIDRHSAAAPPGTAFVRAAAHQTLSPQVQDALARTGFPDGRPDCVLLNSITQCFPSVDYLRAVVLDALDLVAAGGTVIVGDVRHRGLLDDYCRWVERAADPGLDDTELVVRAARRAARDEELLFDPPLLAALAAESPRRVRMATHAKTMRADTELTRYRFDAVLHVDTAPDGPEPQALAWNALPETDRLAALRRTLTVVGPARVTGIPNRLLRPEADGAVAAAELRTALAGLDAIVTCDVTDPQRLEVVAPARHAAISVTDLLGTGTAHEPFGAFVRTRLAEEARRHLRRVTGAPADVTIVVHIGEGAR